MDGKKTKRGQPASAVKEPKRDRSLLALFFEGLIALLPLVLTGLIIYWLGSTIHRLLNIFPEKIFELIFPRQETFVFWVPIYWIVFYLLVAALFFFLTALFGFAIRRSIGRKLFSLWEKLLSKIPLVRNVYEPLRQVFSSLLSGRKDRFKRVVLLEYPRKGLFSLAFVTSEIQAEPGDADGKRFLTLFIPSSPNPTTGWMLVVPESEVVDAQMSVEQGIKLIFSGGLIKQNLKHLDKVVEKLEGV